MCEEAVSAEALSKKCAPMQHTHPLILHTLDADVWYSVDALRGGS